MLWYLFCFGLPQGYFKRILDVDRTGTKAGVTRIRWMNFLRDVVKEWTDSNLLVGDILDIIVAAT